MFKKIKAWFVRAFAPIAPPAAPAPITIDEKMRQLRISTSALAYMLPKSGDTPRPFALPQIAPGVIPEHARAAKMAMDNDLSGLMNFADVSSAYSEGLQFMGYPYLAELTQRPEYRRPAEIIAKEMTRKWIKIQSTGDSTSQNEKAEKIQQIEAEFERLGVQAAFRKAAEQDGFFGRSQIFLDTGDYKDANEMRLPLRTLRSKIPKGALKRIVVIEPIWTYPQTYNATDPIDPTFFKPQSWFVMGKEVHSSRLLTFVSRPVPDLLKPAYAFGGLSLSQMAKPYIDNWLRTRQSVSDLVHSFSVSGLKTNMDSVLQGGTGEDLMARAALFSQARDNRGMMLVDKETEEFFNISVPLGGLDHLQAQSQEHMSAVEGIPLVKLLGITPSGLNASSDGEIRCFYDWIHAQQESLYTPHLKHVLDVVQLSLFGEIDKEIGFKYEALWSLDEAAQGALRKTEADTDGVLIDKGVIEPQEARSRLANQEDSPYASLDLGKEIIAPGAEAGSEPGMEGLHALFGGEEPAAPEASAPALPGAEPIASKPIPSAPVASKPVSSEPLTKALT